MRAVERLVKYSDGTYHLGRIMGWSYLVTMLIGIGWYYLK